MISTSASLKCKRIGRQSIAATEIPICGSTASHFRHWQPRTRPSDDDAARHSTAQSNDPTTGECWAVWRGLPESGLTSTSAWCRGIAASFSRGWTACDAALCPAVGPIIGAKRRDDCWSFQSSTADVSSFCEHDGSSHECFRYRSINPTDPARWIVCAAAHSPGISDATGTGIYGQTCRFRTGLP